MPSVADIKWGQDIVTKQAYFSAPTGALNGSDGATSEWRYCHMSTDIFIELGMYNLHVSVVVISIMEPACTPRQYHKSSVNVGHYTQITGPRTHWCGGHYAHISSISSLFGALTHLYNLYVHSTVNSNQVWEN